MIAMPLIFTSGWTSGINCYAVVLMLGLLGRSGHASAVPATLERPDVLIAAAVLFCCQLLAGKVPYLDSIWDLIHTGIRPVVGGTIGVLMAQHARGSLALAAAAAVIGGGTSLVTHLVKAGIRLGINASPEPVSNILASLLEDVTVAGMVVFALLHPLLASALAAFRNRRARRAHRRAMPHGQTLPDRSGPRPAHRLQPARHQPARGPMALR
jgi:hypothetical protein